MTSKELKEMKEDLQNQFENKKTIIISINVDILIELIENQEKLKQAIDILKDRKNILKYNGLKGTYELGWLTQEEYELLKEVLGNES